MRKAAKTFGRTPRALQDKPGLTVAAELHIDLFQTLFSGHTIPLNDIITLCGLRGVIDLEKTVVIVKELERTVFQYQNRQLKHDGATRRRNQQSGGESGRERS